METTRSTLGVNSVILNPFLFFFPYSMCDLVVLISVVLRRLN